MRLPTLWVLIALALTGCAPKLSDFKLENCNPEVGAHAESIEELKLMFAKCQNSANISGAERDAEYKRWSLKNRAHVFYMQSVYTVITLLMVLVVLAFGLFITYQEFHKDKDSKHQIKFSATGVEVSSKLIGITVLLISLAFAYLFLVNAYPVSEVKSSTAKQVQQAPAAAKQ